VKLRTIICVVIIILSLSGCVIMNQSIIHNDTNDPLIVELYTERKDLGWELKKSAEIDVPPASACKLNYDIFYHTQIRIITNQSIVKLGLLSEESILYSLVKDNEGEYVVQHFTPTTLKNSLYGSSIECKSVNTKELENILYFRTPNKSLKSGTPESGAP